VEGTEEWRRMCNEKLHEFCCSQNIIRVIKSRVKRPGCGDDFPLLSSAEVKGRVELFICSFSRPSWAVIAVTFTFIFIMTIIWVDVLVGKAEGKRPLGRPRRRWEDNIKMDLQEVGRDFGEWMELAQDGDRWRALVSTVMKFRGSIKCGEFLD
jgi:hypothetical protein